MLNYHLAVNTARQFVCAILSLNKTRADKRDNYALSSAFAAGSFFIWSETMYTLKTSASFDSAHFLSGYKGKCSNLHGHRWQIEVYVISDELQLTGEKRGMVIDFSDLKKAVRSIADGLDHSLLYEKGSLKPATEQALRDEGFRLIPLEFRPTAENFAKAFFDELSDDGLNVKKVVVYETPDNCASYEV